MLNFKVGTIWQVINDTISPPTQVCILKKVRATVCTACVTTPVALTLFARKCDLEMCFQVVKMLQTFSHNILHI